MGACTEERMRGIIIACVVATLLSFVCTAELQVPERVSQDATDGKQMLSAHAAKNNFAQEENLQVATHPVTGNAELAQEDTQVGWGHVGRKLLGSSRRRRRRRRRWWGSYRERSGKNLARERSSKERNNKAERQNKERGAKERASKQEKANKASEERKIKKVASEKQAKAEKKAKVEKSAKLKKERSDKEAQRRIKERKHKLEMQNKEQQQKMIAAKEKHRKKIEKEKKKEEKSTKLAEKKKKYMKKVELDKKKAHELAKKGKEKMAKKQAEKAQKEKEKGVKWQKERDTKDKAKEKTEKAKTAEKKNKHEKEYKTNERSVKKMKVKQCMSKWRCGISGLSTPVSVDPITGDVRCMSSNGRDCWWGKCQGRKVPYHGNLAPLICGAMHKKKWGGTGYDTKGHWCNKVKMPVTETCSGPTWKKCADEHKYCKCNGAIRYGKGTKWSKPRTASGTIKCSNSVFGDPLYGTFKECQCMKVSRMHAKAVSAGSTVAFQGGRGGKMCADEGHRVVCNRPWIKTWEKFGVMSGGKGRIALKGGRSGKMCADEINTIRCNRPWIQGWEKFKAVLVGRNVALMGGHGNKYCADDIHGVKCNRPWIKGWEKFTAHTLHTKSFEQVESMVEEEEPVA